MSLSNNQPTNQTNKEPQRTRSARAADKFLKGSYDVILKILILCIWCNRICWHALMFKNHIICQILYIIVVPLILASFELVVALIGQLTQCIVIGRTPQACVRNVMPLTITVSFSFTISTSKRGTELHDTLMMLVCIHSTQAAVKTAVLLAVHSAVMWPCTPHTHKHMLLYTAQVNCCKQILTNDS